MVYRYLNVLLFCGLIVMVFSTGCIQDLCNSVQCQHEGVCVRGACTCTFGYEGDQCEKQWYEKFEGTWKAAETDKKGVVLKEYEVTVLYGGSPDTFRLLNLADTVDTVVCVREAYRTFTILEKTVNDSFKVQSAQGLLNEEGTKVTGLYSLSQKDVITNVGYYWTR